MLHGVSPGVWEMKGGKSGSFLQKWFLLFLSLKGFHNLLSVLGDLVFPGIHYFT
jgi:hypothetical protein